MSLFKTVPPNVVQSIRAFRVGDLKDEATRLGQHFLYAYCAEATTKQQVLGTIANAFLFPKHFGKNFDALGDCLTDLPHKSGAQPGFIVVLEQLPNTPKFDKEAREILLDVFRDAADFWADKKVAFRVFYSFQLPKLGRLPGRADRVVGFLFLGVRNTPSPTDRKRTVQCAP